MPPRKLPPLELENRIETNNTGRERDKDQHCPRHAFVYMLEQCVEGHGQENKKRPIQQVADDPHSDKPGICDNVPGRGRSVAGNVHLGVDKPFGKAAEDAHEQVEYAGDPRRLFV